MNKDKAIETNEAYLERYGKGMLSWEMNAQKLGIEALKRCKYLAEHTERWSDVLLPGETEEV